MRPKEMTGNRKPAPCPIEAEMVIYSYLIAGKPTPEARRLAVRQLLRQASKGLDRSV